MNRLKTMPDEQKFWLFFWIGLLCIMIARNFFFGVNYYNYLDDYNTYGIFNRRNADIWNNVIMWYKLYTFRPLAFFADAYITQWFWPNMWLVLLFYTLMHFFTCVLFKQTLEKSGASFGVFGIVIISLIPLACEAVYWIGASTRLVPGIFFSVLSTNLLVRFIESDFTKKRLLFAFAFFNLLANGFYEQIVVFNLCFTLFIIFLNRKKQILRKKSIVFVPFINLILIGVYYIAFSNQGKISQRNQLVSLSGLMERFKRTILVIGHLFTEAQLVIFKGSLPSGIRLIQSPVQKFIIVFIIIFSILIIIMMFCDKNDIKVNSTGFLIISGLILFIIPFAPFFVLKDSYIFARAAYPSFFGGAIFIQAVLDKLCQISVKRIKLKYIKPVISVILILPFFLTYIAEIHNYKLINETDNIIMENMLREFEATGLSQDVTLVLFNTKQRYPVTSSPRYENITANDWCLIGKANADSKKFYFQKMLAVNNKRKLTADELTEISEDNALLGIDSELNVFPLKLLEDTLINCVNNKIFGTLMPEGDGCRFIYMEEN